MAADDRNGGAMIQKKMKIATAATSALSSGLVRSSFRSDVADVLPRAGVAACDRPLQLSHVLRCSHFNNGCVSCSEADCNIRSERRSVRRVC